ncbi:unnamed protein product, partial [Polarella glacialis]
AAAATAAASTGVEAPSLPEDPWFQARRAAAALGAAARLAGLGVLERLSHPLLEALGMSGADAARVAAVGTARASALSLAEAVCDAARSVPAPAAGALTRVAAAKHDEPLALIQEASASLAALGADESASAAAAKALLSALSRVQGLWDASSPSAAQGAAERYAGPAVLRALVEAECSRLRAVHEDLQLRWQLAKAEAERWRAEYREQGFPEKAACCLELARQAASEDGLRGFVVGRALRSAASGLEALKSSGESAASALGGGLTPSLGLLGRARVDA